MERAGSLAEPGPIRCSALADYSAAWRPAGSGRAGWDAGRRPLSRCAASARRRFMTEPVPSLHRISCGARQAPGYCLPLLGSTPSTVQRHSVADRRRVWRRRPTWHGTRVCEKTLRPPLFKSGMKIEQEVRAWEGGKWTAVRVRARWELSRQGLLPIRLKPEELVAQR